MSLSRRKILVTSALPYANGPIHLGHMVEYIQTDIWARFQRLHGHQCYYVCAEDAHGTPIMLRAEQEKLSPEQLIERFRHEHETDFQDFFICFDNYYSTHSPENRSYAEHIYRKLDEAGYIRRRRIHQAYDPERGMFLPDRFIRGRCPRCKSAEQYGDSCEACGATYNPTELIDAVSALSGVKPVERESEHYFFDLPAFEGMLREWIQTGCRQSEVAHKIQEWFDSGLKEWDISRDAPYFGFRIPDTKDKYFYVWLDAPIGYLASFRNLCDREGIDFDAYMKPGGDTELYHFIGKDIIYFHGLFWPAMLKGSGFRTPSAICAHGFLTIDGQKMSKSRGTFITARAYLNHLNPEYLRYYFAFRLDHSVSDINLSMDDFISRVNSDLIGKVINLASRCAGFIHRHFGGQLGERLHEPALFEECAAAAESIAAAYEGRQFSRAMREIMQLADQGNQYITRQRPWELAKKGDHAELQAICATGLNCFRQLMIYLKPVLPVTARATESFLSIDPLHWQDAQQPLLAHQIAPFQPMLQRIEQKRIDAMLKEARTDLAPEGQRSPEAARSTEQPTPVGIDDFMRIDLRVARIIRAETVDGAERLLQLQLDLGKERRTVFAGIRGAYTPRQLEGRLAVVVANLEPRKMRFGVSEGMILAADGAESGGIFLLAPDSGAEPGMRIR